MNYYRINPKLFDSKWAYPEIYANCLNYDHNVKEEYCPLCKRPVLGSKWLGPYNVYLSSKKIPNVLFGTCGMIFDMKFKNAFLNSNLKGIYNFQEYNVFYKGKQLEDTFFHPLIEFSKKKFEFSIEQNEKRQNNKSLPKCSLCRNSGRGAYDDGINFYFDENREYDIFRIYENPSQIYCNQEFYDFCLQNNFTNIIEHFERIVINQH